MADQPIVLDTDARTRIFLVLAGCALVVAAFATPWWTRGMTFDTPEGTEVPGAEGLYVHYGPFETGTALGMATDASRETVTGLLGILAVGCTLFLATAFALRFLRSRGRVECSPDLPVVLTITAFGLGVAAVLTAALFLPLMGSNPGFLWGQEGGDDVQGVADDMGVEFTRYANAGFFFGILAFVAFPVYAWVDANRARLAEEIAEGKAARAPTPSSSAGTPASLASRARGGKRVTATPSLE